MINEAVILFIIGLAILIKSSELTIKYVIKFSHLVGISQMAIGFIIIAVSTSLPEFSVAILSSLRGEGILSYGNVVGANVSNLTLIFGLIAILTPFSFRNMNYRRIISAVAITSIIALLALILGTIGIVFGLLCLVIFIIFCFDVIKEEYVIGAIRSKIQGLKTVETAKTFLLLIFSITFVVISAKIIVNSAAEIASYLKITESVIGATILAFGTTLPELSIGITAARKGKISIVIGDALGSIVTNFTLVLGTAALISPIKLGMVSRNSTIGFLIIAMAFLIMSSRIKFDKLQGIIFLLIYFAFIALVLATGIFAV